MHAETVRVVGEQVKDLDVQMAALDDFVTRARSENAVHHEKQASSMLGLASTVERSYGDVKTHCKSSFDRVKALEGDMSAEAGGLREALEPLGERLGQPLADLREDIAATELREYEPTGDTPEKLRYDYPTNLPRTAAHEVLIAEMRDDPPPTPSRAAASSGPVVFADLDHPNLLKSPPRTSTVGGLAPSEKTTAQHPHPFSMSTMSLREVNPNLNLTTNLTANLTMGSLMFDPSTSTMSAVGGGGDHTLPLFKRSTRAQRGRKQAGGAAAVAALDGRENLPPPAFSQSLSRRKSPRLN